MVAKSAKVLPREFTTRVDRGCVRSDLLLGKATERVPELLVLVRQAESIVAHAVEDSDAHRDDDGCRTLNVLRMRRSPRDESVAEGTRWRRMSARSDVHCAGCSRHCQPARQGSTSASQASHFDEGWAQGVFFAVVAWSQLAWTVGVVLSPTRRSLVLGVLLNAAVIGVWAVSRVWGVPIGPGAWTPEPVIAGRRPLDHFRSRHRRDRARTARATGSGPSPPAGGGRCRGSRGRGGRSGRRDGPRFHPGVRGRSHARQRCRRPRARH